MTFSVAQAVTKEQAVKAGFVYNITKFVVWPSYASRDKNFNLCVIGDEKLDGALEALYGKLVSDKPIVLRRTMNEKNYKECQIAFIANASPKKIKKILSALKPLPVLTVSDSPNFINDGGMVGLIRDGRRVGFEVNLTVVRAAGLHMGAQLLKLAKNVKGLK